MVLYSYVTQIPEVPLNYYFWSHSRGLTELLNKHVLRHQHFEKELDQLVVAAQMKH